MHCDCGTTDDDGERMVACERLQPVAPHALPRCGLLASESQIGGPSLHAAQCRVS